MWYYITAWRPGQALRGHPAERRPQAVGVHANPQPAGEIQFAHILGRRHLRKPPMEQAVANLLNHPGRQMRVLVHIQQRVRPERPQPVQ